MTTKNLYILLKETNSISSEKYLCKPYRAREKQMGFMWEGKLEVKLQNHTQIIFSLWNHYDNDSGDNWYPSENEIASHWRPSFVPIEYSPGSKLVDADWHLLYVDCHVYVSKIGFFPEPNYKSHLIDIIKNNKWMDNPDIWRLI